MSLSCVFQYVASSSTHGDVPEIPRFERTAPRGDPEFNWYRRWHGLLKSKSRVPKPSTSLKIKDFNSIRFQLAKLLRRLQFEESANHRSDGQDGAYLAEFLLSKGYEVHGMKRRSCLFDTGRIDHMYEDAHNPNPSFILHYGDMTDSSSLILIMQKVQPDKVYKLKAESSVQVSFEEPEHTVNSDAIEDLRLLESIRILGLEREARFYQTSTSEPNGSVQEIPQKETTPFYPRSPNAVAKIYRYWITVNYREAYGNCPWHSV